MKDRLLRRPEVEERVCLSTSRIYALMGMGHFPRPIRIGNQAVAWRESDIENWINTRPLAGPEPKSVPASAEAF